MNDSMTIEISEGVTCIDDVQGVTANVHVACATDIRTTCKRTLNIA